MTSKFHFFKACEHWSQEHAYLKIHGTCDRGLSQRCANIVSGRLFPGITARNHMSSQTPFTRLGKNNAPGGSTMFPSTTVVNNTIQRAATLVALISVFALRLVNRLSEMSSATTKMPTTDARRQPTGEMVTLFLGFLKTESTTSFFSFPIFPFFFFLLKSIS